MKKAPRSFVACSLILLVLSTCSVASAEPWTTNGGNQWRGSRVSEPAGFIDLSDPLKLPLGQSATQPVMMDDRIFHVAGPGMWRLRLDPVTGRPEDLTDSNTLRLVARSNQFPKTGSVKVASSTPTFSPDSKWLYWGTAHGEVWGVDTQTGQTHFVSLDEGCSVVSSPLVLRRDGRDVVIVGQKPVEGRCDKTGKVWAIWDLDKGASRTTSYAIGGWATPSPVPDPYSEGGFFAGADGTGCPGGNGTVARLQVVGTPGQYQIGELSKRCTGAGVAGSLAVSYGNLYWVDVDGVLHARRLADWTIPTGWSSGDVDLSEAINEQRGINKSSASAFTNTKPAVEAWMDESGRLQGTVWVTLRNYVGNSSEGLKLRDCPSGFNAPVSGLSCPGAPGALVAVDIATGKLKNWYRQPLEPFRKDGATGPWAAANTDPIIVKSWNAVIYGDAHGNVRARPLSGHDGDMVAGIRNDFASDLDLLSLVAGDGESSWPMLGHASYSQISGAGVDPVVTSGGFQENADRTLFMMGVNRLPPADKMGSSWQYGHLVILPVGSTFNLSLTDQDTSPGGPWKPSTEVTVTARARLDYTRKRLDELRTYPPGVSVSWYMVPKDWNYQPDTVIQLGSSSTPLPGTMREGSVLQVPFTFTFTDEHPDEGTIYGVIDAGSLAHDTTRHEGRLAKLLEAGANRAHPAPKVMEMVTLPDGSNGLADNFVTIPFQKQVPVDLAISLDLPKETYTCQESNAVASTITITNNSRVAVTNIRANLVAGSRTLWTGTIPQLNPWRSVTVQGAPAMGTCGKTHTLVAQVNPSRNPEETDYANNTARATITVQEWVSTEPVLQRGEGKFVIIVDQSCISSVESEGTKPCSNLDVRHPDQ